MQNSPLKMIVSTDIGAAADYCERAMFAFDRALMPGFSLNGACRLDFDRVENRPLFLALHREVTLVCPNTERQMVAITPFS